MRKSLFILLTVASISTGAVLTAEVMANDAAVVTEVVPPVSVEGIATSPVTEPPITASAATPTTAPAPADQGVSDLVTAYKSGDILLALLIALYLFTKVVRLGLGHFIPWFNTKLGGLVTSFAASSLALLITSLKTNMSLTLPVVLTVLVTTWASSGLHGHVKDLIQARLAAKK